MNAHAQRALAMLQRAKERGLASDVTLVRKGAPGAYNPQTGRVEGASAPTTYTGIGMKDGYKQSDIDGTLVRQGDQELYVDAVGMVRPITEERITVGTVAYVVKATEVIAPGDADVLYILQIRGV